MGKSFTGAEFIKALSENAVKQPIKLEGMVKKHESQTDVIMFAQGLSCHHWTRIPLSMIETVDLISTVPCRDHEHPFVQLHLKEPAPGDVAGQIFAELLRYAPHRSAPEMESIETGVYPMAAYEQAEYDDPYLPQSTNMFEFSGTAIPTCNPHQQRVYCGGRWWCAPQGWRCCGTRPCGYPYKCCRGRCIPWSQICH